MQTIVSAVLDTLSEQPSKEPLKVSWCIFCYLNGELEHEIYMTIPEGYTKCIEQCEADEALKLEKAIYGLVQPAQQFFKKICDSLLQANFKQVKLIHA